MYHLNVPQSIYNKNTIAVLKKMLAKRLQVFFLRVHISVHTGYSHKYNCQRAMRNWRATFTTFKQPQ